jgi:predicted nucleic acid-binding protein
VRTIEHPASHRLPARDLHRELGELLNGAHQGHHDEQIVRGIVADLGISILAIDAAVAERAAFLQAQHARSAGKRDPPRLRTPDALILATASLSEQVDTVVCGDVTWRNVAGLSVEIELLRPTGKPDRRCHYRHAHGRRRA